LKLRNYDRCENKTMTNTESKLALFFRKKKQLV
jgi:hypothetical protein